MELPVNKSSVNEISQKVMLLLLAVSLNAIEMALPRLPFLPWLKPGFANIVTIIWLFRYGLKDALLYTFLRSWISGFFFGFSFTTLMLSLSGGILATIVMGLAHIYLFRKAIIGTLGLAMLGAIFHNIGQIITVYYILIKNTFIFYQFPFMCGASLVFGGMIGLLVPLFSDSIEKTEVPHLSESSDTADRNRQVSAGNKFISFLLFLFCILILLIESKIWLGILALVITFSVQITFKGSLKKLLYPVRFWSLFLFIAFMYLFFSYGTRINGIPFMTVEGLEFTLNQCLRLWIWLQTGLLLSLVQFHDFFFSIMKKAFPKSASTLNAGLYAIEFFPDIVSFSKSKEARKGLQFFKKPHYSFTIFFNRVMEQIVKLHATNQ
jgi:heptaprenyl diphosphate synthase